MPAVEPWKVEGPYSSASEVTAVLGHDRWRIMRRPDIEQGTKFRPTDNGLEAQPKGAFSSTICLDLQDADYVVAISLLLGASPQMQWMGKTLDLSKAYKQLPIEPGHRDCGGLCIQSGEPIPLVLLEQRPSGSLCGVLR